MMATTNMSPIEAAFLGVVQGLTEFLPISSTAHLRVVPALLHWPDPGVTFSAVIQLGSVIAVLAYFGKDLIGIARGFFQALRDRDFTNHNVRLVAGIFLGTIPICVAGLLMKKMLETDGGPLRSLVVIGTASIVMGIVLFIAERFGKRHRTLENVGAQDGLLLGLGQALALIPGCSRSGSSLTVALFLGLKRPDAARFTFLLGIPAIILSGLFELKKALGSPLESIPNLVVALITATIVSYAAIWWMLRYLQNHSTIVFVIYRLIFGVAVIALSMSGFIQ
jgi:undecaprenyl-diphosphatase